MIRFLASLLPACLHIFILPYPAAFAPAGWNPCCSQYWRTLPKMAANFESQANLANLSTVPISNDGRVEMISSSMKTTGR